MSDAAHNAAPPPPAHVPSVFISYAAEDRVAARALRDTLSAAGLDVWYDEEELSGGDAWDQKIRRQIRDCDYFMPVISASTEARKEGYFRREWRLATERTLDMADDVLFLLPIAIDGTSEVGARVPEKFFTVQWLRVPGGQPTPALSALLQRLRAGEHHVAARVTHAPFAHHRNPAPLPPPVLNGPAPVMPPPPPEPVCTPSPTPPAMPPLPHVPEKGGLLHGVKFILEVFWWLLTAAWLLFARLPKWARILVTVWIVVTLFSSNRCSRTGDAPTAPPTPSRGTPGRGDGSGPKKFRQAVEQAVQSSRDGRGKLDKLDLGKLAAEVAYVFGEGVRDTAAAGKALVVVPFAPPSAEAPGAKFAHGVFLALYGQLVLERRDAVGVVPPGQGPPEPAALVARAAMLGARFVLAASPVAEAENPVLEVKLFSVADAKLQWTESFAIKGTDDTAVAEKIANEVLTRLPKPEPPRSP